MKYPNKAIIENLRNVYPRGTRIELIEMDDIQAPPIGTKGTVIGIDDIGSILVSWDNNTSLSLAYGVDRFKPIKE